MESHESARKTWAANGDKALGEWAVVDEAGGAMELPPSQTGVHAAGLRGR
ncbi:hypothetical protein ACE3MS_02300 [Paenibacillus dendritiformis]